MKAPRLEPALVDVFRKAQKPDLSLDFKATCESAHCPMLRKGSYFNIKPENNTLRLPGDLLCAYCFAPMKLEAL